MFNEFLYGKPVKEAWLDEIKEELIESKLTPSLAIIQVGDREDSNRYIRNKMKSAKKAGILVELIKLPEETTQEKLIEYINGLNNNILINGIIVQLPLPNHIDEMDVNKTILPIKDVDGFTDTNVGKTLLGLDSMVSCTPLGIMKLFEYYNIDVYGKDVVVIGRSNIVGKPMSSLLINKGATVTICNSKTKNLKEKTQSVDIVIVATGQRKFFDSTFFSDYQIIVDVGVNFIEEGIQCGDVDTNDVISKLNNIKLVPSPNGCGQTTVAALLYNTLKADKMQLGKI